MGTSLHLPAHLLVLVPVLVACTPSNGDGTAPTASPPAPQEVSMSDAPPDPPAPAEPVVAPSAVRLGARTKATRQPLYGAGLVRPATAADLGALGLPADGELPVLVVLATEHPSLAPPELQVKDRDGRGAALVLTWLEHDLMSGPLPEVAEVTYAWAVSGALPRWLVLRKAATADGLSAALAAEAGPGTLAAAVPLASATGPAVSLEPSYLVRGTDGFFAQYGVPRPAGVGDGLALAAVRPTASGRKATAMEALPLAGGGARVRITVPLDPGLPVWGPRAGDELATFSSPLPQGAFEWLLELQ